MTRKRVPPQSQLKPTTGQVKKVRAIIYDKKNSKPYFLILHRILRWQGCELLKETIEQEESIEEALNRGIKEETDLKKFKIIKSLNKQEEWQALGNNYKVIDTFLVRADMDQKIIVGQEIMPARHRKPSSRGVAGGEHDEYQWTDKETAIEKLTHLESKKLLKELDL